MVEAVQTEQPHFTAAKEKPPAAICVERYADEKRAEWNDFIKSSKNGTFLFQRDYMEYHADRFADFSLMFRSPDGKLLAVMPASINNHTLASHAGLTYGGIISGIRMKTPLMLEIFDALINFARGAGLQRIVYKAIPHIYHSQPAEEDLYALFRFAAQLVRRDVSTTILPNRRLPLTKGRKWATAQSRKSPLAVRESKDFINFMRLEAELLAAKYNTIPVHSAAEIELLARRFPENIKLFAAFQNEEMLSGVLIYESSMVAHAQYIAASKTGKSSFALDTVLQFLVDDYYAAKPFFDFGISTEQQGHYLNAGLIDFKESWGGRATVYDTYEITLS